MIETENNWNCGFPGNAAIMPEQKEDYLESSTGLGNSPKRADKSGDSGNYIRKLNTELFNLWRYLDKEDLWEDAQEFLEEHRYDELPFDIELK